MSPQKQKHGDFFHFELKNMEIVWLPKTKYLTSSITFSAKQERTTTAGKQIEITAKCISMLKQYTTISQNED